MDLLFALLLSFLGGFLSVFSICSLLLIPALLVNKPLARNRMPFFILGIGTGTLLFVGAAYLVENFGTARIIPTVGVLILALGSAQLFQACKRKDCKICTLSKTEKASNTSLGFVSSGFYGCTTAPIASILAYLASENASFSFIIALILTYLAGRITCFVSLLLMPLNFYTRKLVKRGVSGRATNMISGLLALPIGLYLSLFWH